jgi:hypothetical protein
MACGSGLQDFPLRGIPVPALVSYQTGHAANEAKLREKLADVVRKDPSLFRLDTLGQSLFSIVAILEQDPHAWYRVQNVGLRKRLRMIPVK